MSPTDYPEHEPAGSPEAQEVIDALFELLGAAMYGENWGRSIRGGKDRLAQALDALVAPKENPHE